MALPKRKTTLSVLRTIIGPKEGNAFRLANRIGRSESWITKVSCGQIPLTGAIARSLAYETGVNPRWLLANDPEAPPVDREGKPYTLETFLAHRQNDENRVDFVDFLNAESDLCDCIQEAIYIMTNAGASKNRGGYFIFLLKEFLEDAKKRFGSAEIRGWARAAEYPLEVARDILKIDKEKAVTPEEFRKFCEENAARKSPGRKLAWEDIRGGVAANSGVESASEKSAAKGTRKANAKPASKRTAKAKAKHAARATPKRTRKK
jgi:hypothetical protein